MTELGGRRCAAWTIVANVLLNLDEAVTRNEGQCTRSPNDSSAHAVTRRHFFEQASFGIGGLALASLHGPRRPRQRAATPPRRRTRSQFAPKVKRVIYLFMAGAPSQLDLFDPKPALTKHDGQDIPAEFIKGERFAFIKGTPKLLGSPFQFSRHGQSGAEISELLPQPAKLADDIAIVRSMQTTQFNHAPAQIFMNTGHQVIGRPSLGSWLSYGLGTENSDLPAFVVLLSGENKPDGGKSCWGSGFLPTTHQGVEFRSSGEPVLFVSNPPTASTPRSAADSIAAINDLNRRHALDVGDPEIQTRIAAYELAYRMQTSVPELTDRVEGAAGDPRAVRHRAGQGVVREQLPARPPAGRARRPVRAALSPRLGHARRQLRRGHRREAAAAVPPDGPARVRRC